MWGDANGTIFANKLDKIYVAITKWRKNIFPLPYGAAGKRFCADRLCKAYAERSELERVAIKALMVMEPLLLQKPHRRSKTKDHTACAVTGNLDSLFRECSALQEKLESSQRRESDENLPKKFADLMFKGKSSYAPYGE